jgi:hypothetical protein
MARAIDLAHTSLTNWGEQMVVSEFRAHGDHHFFLSPAVQFSQAPRTDIIPSGRRTVVPSDFSPMEN